MKKIIPFLLILVYAATSAQSNSNYSEKLVSNESNLNNPFGQPHPNAPEEILTYDKFIGECNCKSVRYSAGVAGDTLPLLWRWKYILNGMAVQDDGWFGNDTAQSAFTSVRILNPQTKKWHVPFFNPQMIRDPQIWVGGKEGKDIVLKRTQKTQNGGEIESILTFSNITDKGFYWNGKIKNPKTNNESIFWEIWCVKE